MDRLNGRQVTVFWPGSKRLGLLAFLLLVLGIMAYKAYDAGWFLPRTPLAFHDQPTLVLFNRHKGCECALVVYQAAARQLREWPEAPRQGVQLIQVDLDRRPDLGEQYHIVRAPTLLLLDTAGNVVYRQEEAVSDMEPLDMYLLEKEIRQMRGGD